MVCIHSLPSIHILSSHKIAAKINYKYISGHGDFLYGSGIVNS